MRLSTRSIPVNSTGRQALDNFAHLFTESESVKQQAQAHDQEVTELYAQIGKLTTPSTLSRTERQALLDGGPDALPVTTQTALLSLNRSSLYYRPVGPDPVEVTLKHRIDEIYTSAPFTGRAASPHNCSGKAMPSTASVCSAICTRWGFGALRRGRIRVRPNPGPRSIRTY